MLPHLFLVWSIGGIFKLFFWMMVIAFIAMVAFRWEIKRIIKRWRGKQ